MLIDAATLLVKVYPTKPITCRFSSSFATGSSCFIRSFTQTDWKLTGSLALLTFLCVTAVNTIRHYTCHTGLLLFTKLQLPSFFLFQLWKTREGAIFINPDDGRQKSPATPSTTTFQKWHWISKVDHLHLYKCISTCRDDILIELIILYHFFTFHMQHALHECEQPTDHRWSQHP